MIMSTLDLRAASDESPTSAWFMARGRVLLVEGGWRNQQLSPGSEGASWPRRRHHQKVPRGLGDGIIAAMREGLDSGPGKSAEHLRALMHYHGLFTIAICT